MALAFVCRIESNYPSRCCLITSKAFINRSNIRAVNNSSMDARRSFNFYQGDFHFSTLNHFSSIPPASNRLPTIEKPVVCYEFNGLEYSGNKRNRLQKSNPRRFHFLFVRIRGIGVSVNKQKKGRLNNCKDLILGI